VGGVQRIYSSLTRFLISSYQIFAFGKDGSPLQDS